MSPPLRRGAYLVAMPYFLIMADYSSLVDHGQKVAALVEHAGSMYVTHLLTLVLVGVVLAGLTLRLWRRLAAGLRTLTPRPSRVGRPRCRAAVVHTVAAPRSRGSALDRQSADPDVVVGEDDNCTRAQIVINQVEVFQQRLCLMLGGSVALTEQDQTRERSISSGQQLTEVGVRGDQDAPFGPRDIQTSSSTRPARPLSTTWMTS